MATLTVNKPEVDSAELVKGAQRRGQAMLHEQNDWRQDWYEIATLTGHRKLDFLRETDGGTDKSRPARYTLHDSHPVKSFRYLENGMYSGLSNPNRPWFKLQIAGMRGELMASARVWLDEVEQILADMLSGSNFYGVCRSNYGELGRFGIAAAIMDEHWEKGVVCTALTIGEFGISVNDDGEVDSLVRRYGRTTRQLYDAHVRQPDGSEQWGNVSDQVKLAYQNGNLARKWHVWHLIEPNPDFVEGAMGWKGMRWRSIKWQAEGSKLLQHSGYHEQPFWVPRWKVQSGDIWGEGPGADALADLRELQFQAKRKGLVTDMVAKPPTYGPAKKVNMQPGAHTSLAQADATMKIEPIYKIPVQAIQLVSDDVRALHNAIDEATYADLFMAITERDGVQPINEMEAQLRNDEKMSQLGPVIESVTNDMLAVAIDRAFGIALRGDLLPPPPEELQDREIDIEFVSVLAQAQKMMGMGQTERTLAFAASVAQFDPDVIDNIDGDALVKDHWARSGAPAVGLRDQAEVEERRKARAQQAQMQQMAEMAGPAKDGVEAASLLNEMGQQA